MKIQSIVYFKIIMVHIMEVLYIYILILCILAHQSAYFLTILQTSKEAQSIYQTNLFIPIHLFLFINSILLRVEEHYSQLIIQFTLFHLIVFLKVISRVFMEQRLGYRYTVYTKILNTAFLRKIKLLDMVVHYS